MNLFESIKNNLNDNIIKIKLYGDTKKFNSLAEALNYIQEAISYCDPNSSECQRYYSIYQQLKSGKTNCSDELDESGWSDEAKKEIRQNGIKYYAVYFEKVNSPLVSEDSCYRTKKNALKRLEDLKGQLGNSYKVWLEEIYKAKGTDGSMEDFRINESENGLDYVYEEKSVPEDLKVETCIVEQTGGYVYVGYGRLANGTYYAISSDLVSLYDEDIYAYEYDENGRNDVDSYNWEMDHMVGGYDYNDPEYKVILKQCIKLDNSAKHIAFSDQTEEIDKELSLEEIYKKIDDLYNESQLKESLSSNSGSKRISDNIKVMNYKGTYIVLKNGHNEKEFPNEEDATIYAKELARKSDNKVKDGDKLNEADDIDTIKRLADENKSLTKKIHKLDKTINKELKKIFPRYEIEYAIPNYTGGSIYVYTGKLKDGNYFIADDGWMEDDYRAFSIRIVNADPDNVDDPNQDDIAMFPEWQEEHLVKDLEGKEAKQFTKQILEWIINNKPKGNYQVGDMQDILDYANGKSDTMYK